MKVTSTAQKAAHRVLLKLSAAQAYAREEHRVAEEVAKAQEELYTTLRATVEQSPSDIERLKVATKAAKRTLEDYEKKHKTVKAVK